MSRNPLLGILVVSAASLLFSPVSLGVTIAVGRTAGTFNVSPTGAFTYSIPIQVAPGPRGIAPHLSLVYNSRSGSGALGVGWSLGGISSIYRCNLTYAQDAVPGPVTLTYSDRFCMDGKRLRLTSSETLSTYGSASTTYQTELADFSNVTASATTKGNGPAYFTVQGKDGYVYVYGLSNSAGGANSQVEYSGATTPTAWMLSQIEDRYGNTLVAFNYGTSAGGTVSVLGEVLWSPTSAGASTFNYTLSLNYGSNTPQGSKYLYQAGASVAITGLLNSIWLSYQNSTYQNYQLTYSVSPTTGREELTTVQQCASTTQTNCLAPTTIAYQSGAAGAATPATSTGGGASAVTVMTADVNGDGLDDIIYATQSGSTLTWWVQFATATGFTAPINTGATSSSTGWVTPLIDDFLGNGANEIMAPNGGTWYVYAWNGTSFTATSTGVAVDSSAWTYAVADINGDGKADLAELNLVSGYFYLVTRLNTSSGSSVSFSSSTTSTPTNITNQTTEDIQGKGLYGDNDVANTPVRRFDWNGNKLYGFMLAYWYDVNQGQHGFKQFNTLEAWAPNGSGGFAETDAWIVAQPAYSIPVPINWNDDACTDLYFEGSVLISGCNGGTQSTLTFYSSPTGLEKVVAVDWSGHGRTDILANFGGGTTLTEYTSTGIGVASGVATTLTSANYVVFNPTGDGLNDLLTIGASNLLYGLHNGAGQPADLLNSITDGYGVNVSPSYASIAQSNYTEATDGVYPDRNFIGPLYVVSQYSATSPASAGGTYTKSFAYTGAHLNVQGRGFDGFETVQATDSRAASPVVTQNYYASFPQFPFTGMDIGPATYQNGSTTPISITQNTWTETSLDSTAYNQRYFPYVQSQMVKTYEVGGTENTQLITQASTTYAYDNYGNATSISQVLTDEDPNSPYTGKTWTTATTNVFDVDGTNNATDVANWCLPLPNSSVVTYSSSLSGSSTVIRTKNFVLDTAAHCRVTQIITEPSSATYKVTEVLGYDAFSNINSDAITGINMATRTSTANWGTTGQFALTKTNPLSQTTTAAYANAANFEFGVPSSLTDPNGIATSWGYDAFGRKNLETRPDGTETTWTPTWCTSNCSWENSEYQIAKAQFESNGTTVIRTDTTTYDPFDHVTETSGPSLSGTAAIAQKTYDLYGRLATQSFPYLSGASEYWQTTTYDAISRPTLVQRPISSSNSTLQSTSFQYAGRTAISTDAMSKTKTTVNDVNGWLRKTTDGVGYAVTIAYDAAGSPLQRTDSLGHTLSTFTYAYGIAPFKIAATDADLGAWSYTFDALGEMSGWEDAKSQSFSETYDALSRPLTRTEPDLFTQWTWGATAASHNIGQLQRAQHGRPRPRWCG
jgi:YD repeat-containing protein